MARNDGGENWQMPPGLSLNSAKEALAARFGVRMTAPVASRCRCYDTYEWGLWFAGLVLCATEGQLRLCRLEHQWLGEELARVPLRPGAPPRLCADSFSRTMRAQLAPVMGLRSLRPVADVYCRGRTVALLDGNRKVVFRFQLLDLHETETARLPVFRLCRLLPLRGYDAKAAAATALLRALGAREIGDQGPLGAWYARLGDGPRPYTLKPVFGLQSELPARQAVRTIVCRMLAIGRSNEHGIVADLDTESLHDYRICLRKIRSALSLIRGVYPSPATQRLKRTLHDLAAGTNALRDLDVYLLARTDYMAMLPPELAPLLEPIFSDFAEHRAVEQRRVARSLRSAAYERKLDKLAQFFTQPDELPASETSGQAIGPLVAGHIYRRFRKISKIQRVITPATPDGAIHQVRLHCKKLRYMLELFAELFPAEDAEAILKALRRLQNRLGEFNDYAVQKAFLVAYWQDRGRQRADAVDLGVAIGALVGALHQHQLKKREGVFAAMARFCSPKISDHFRQVFKSRGGAGH